ncbi:MAG: hypothetical protein ACI3ZF_04665 [Candidatus Cryptobacteroides sp.]
MSGITDTDVKFVKTDYETDSSAVVLTLNVIPYFTCVEGGKHMVLVESSPEAELMDITEIDWSTVKDEKLIWCADYDWFSVSCMANKPQELSVKLFHNDSGFDRNLKVSVYRQKGNWYGHDSAHIIQKAK